MVLFLQNCLLMTLRHMLSCSLDRRIWRNKRRVLPEGAEVFMNLNDALPFLIPLIVAQFALLGITLHHILTHTRYKRGTRALWLVVVILGMEFIGPILYFLIGKED